MASEFLKGKLPETCLYAIKCHDYRTGSKPKSKLDKALIIADTLVAVAEKINENEELEPEKMKEGIRRLSKNQPWIKDNLRKIEELGLKRNEVLNLVTSCLKKMRKT